MNTQVETVKHGPLKRITAAVREADPKQRKAAGNIFKFLAVLFVLTLIARGTSGATLAKVELSSPQRALIMEAVTGSAVVSSKNTVEITAPEGLTILEMLAGSGQSVNAGDAVARFDADEVAQKLARALAELDKSLIDLGKLERVDEADSSSIDSAQRSLRRAREDYEATKAQGEADVQTAREALEEALGVTGDDVDITSLENAIRSRQRAAEDYDSVKTQGEEDIAAALKTLEEAKEASSDPADATALDNAKRSLERAKDDYTSTKQQGEADVKAANDALAAAKKNPGSYVDFTAVETASRNVQRARDDRSAVRAQGNAEVSAAQAALDEDPGNELLAQQLADAKKRADENYLAATRKVEDAEASLRSAEEAYYKNSQQSADSRQAEIDKAQSSYDSAKTRAEDNLQSAQRKLEDAESSYLKAEQDYEKSTRQTAESKQAEIDKAQTSYDNACVKASDNLQSAQRKLEDADIALNKAENDYSKSEAQSSDKAVSDIEKAQSALKSAVSKAEDNLLSAARKVEDAENSLTKARQDYDKSVKQAFDSEVQNSASATILRFDIEKQESVVSELDKLMRNGCVLYSEIGGVVSSSMAEGAVTNQAPVLTFRDGAKGYEATMRISKTDAAKLTVGDECEVTTGGGSMYFTPTVMASVSAISAPDDNDTATVTLRLPERDWTEGQKVDAQVVISTGNYDQCVPVSALRSDNTGYYIFVVEQRNTVMGMQNIVVRENVSITASDDENASVRGALSRDSNVIVSSNKSVQSGDRVRLSDG